MTRLLSDRRNMRDRSIEVMGSIKQALNWAESGELKKAYDTCKRILEIDPFNQIALKLFGQVALMLGCGLSAYRYMSGLAKRNKNSNVVAIFCGEYAADLPEANKLLLEMIERLRSNIFDYSVINEMVGFYQASGNEKRANFVSGFNLIVDAIAKSKGNIDYSTSGSFQYDAPTKTTSDNAWVCFVAGIKSPRISKLSQCIRSQGFMVCLVTHQSNQFDVEEEKNFDQVVYLKNPFDLIDVLSEERYLALHVFTGADGGFAEALITLMVRANIAVIDFYDLADPSMSPLTRMKDGTPEKENATRNAEIFRFLINHYIAICARALYSKYHRSYLHSIRRRQKRIYLPETSFGRARSRPKLSESDGHLHVVHGGTFLVENAYKSRWPFILSIAEKAEALGIIFHLYPMVWGEQNMSAYTSIAEKSRSFHIHEPVPYGTWLDLLEQYDVGLYFVHAENKELEGNTPRNIDPSGTWANKFGDYLDADLYAITPPAARVLSFVTKRYGIGEPADIRKIHEKAYWDNIKAKVFDKDVDFARAKSLISMPAQSSRLIKFYQSIGLS